MLFVDRRAQPHPDAGHLSLASETGRDERRRFQGGRRIGNAAAHCEHRPRLGRAQLGLTAALQLQRAQPSDGDGHHQEEQQIQPLLGG